MLYMNAPYMSKLMQEAFGEGGYTSSLIKMKGITYGKGTAVSVAEGLKLVEQQTILEAYAYATIEGYKQKGITRFSVHRGSTYDCSVCDEVCARIYSVNEIPIPVHVRCCCYTVPIEDGTATPKNDIIKAGNEKRNVDSALYQRLLKYGKENIIGKYEYGNAAFGGRKVTFTRNSFTENLRFGELFYPKADVLVNIESYLNRNAKLTWERNVDTIRKPYVNGYYKLKTTYKGRIPKYYGREMEFQFEDRGKDGIIFHFIKFI